MKRIKAYILLSMSIILLNSCNQWLEVTPQGDAKADDLLTTTEGFNSALAGVYYMMIKTDMYNGDMTYGALDVLAQYWNISNDNHRLSKFADYDYENITIKSTINGWWTKYYTAISQCNQILEAIEENKGNIKTPEIFEGELLAFRAFLHLQVYRLFGPVVQNDSDLDQPAISYRTTYDNVAKEFKTCREVLTLAKEDLKKALELLNNDPIKDGHKRDDFNKSQLAYNNLLINRAARFNYFGVMGLLARTEQLLLNQSETDGAFYWANRILQEVEDNYSIGLALKDDVDSDTESSRDLMYSSEVICSFYVNNLYSTAGAIFRLGDFEVVPNTALDISEADYDNLVNYVYGRTPDGSGTDYRLNHWFKQSGSVFPFQKYKEPSDLGTIYEVSYPEIAIYRLSEVYYTLCEAKIGIDNAKALEYLNTLRTARGLANIDEAEKDDVATFLMRERKKEFIGEGRMFFTYKRLFSNIEVSDSKTIAASKTIFELPIPEDEYTFGPNDKPNN